MSESHETEAKPQFNFCPQCGRKGLYHVRQQFYRCRYCGTYLITVPEAPPSSLQNGEASA